MNTSLSAFVTGLVMLSGAGIAQAADVAQTNTQSKAISVLMAMPAAQTETATTTTNNSQDRKLVALTDEQMGGVTAGHYTGWWWHFNYKWIDGYYYRTADHY
jgi:hypothetical protein